MGYLRFVFVEGFGAEALVPDTAALVVEGFVASRDDGDAGEEKVVEGGFGAFAAGTIDLGHG